MKLQDLKNELKEIIKANDDKDFSLIFSFSLDIYDRGSFVLAYFDNKNNMKHHIMASSFEECKTKLTQYFELQNVVEEQKLEPQPEIEV